MKLETLPYVCSFISFPVLFITILYQKWYLFPVYSFMIVPLLDYIIPKQKMLSEEDIEKIQNDKTFERLLLGWSFTYFITQLWCYYFVQELNWFNLFIAGIASGILSSQCFTVAHEILHKSGKFNVVWAQILLMMNSYLHFYVVHKQIHHAYVGTEKDPSSAPRGMSIYEFIPRSIFGNLKILLVSNPFLVFGTSFISFLYGYTLISYHLNSFIFWVIQTITAIIIVEIVNYVEHYGVKRENSSSVLDCHSWDSYHPFMNWILFRIGYHSQHHQQANIKYQVLNEKEKSLKLPFDYPIMMLISLYPKLYFSLTHPRLK